MSSSKDAESPSVVSTSPFISSRIEIAFWIANALSLFCLVPWIETEM